MCEREIDIYIYSVGMKSRNLLKLERPRGRRVGGRSPFSGTRRGRTEDPLRENMLLRVAHRLPRPATVLSARTSPRTVQRLLCTAKPGARGPNPKPKPGARWNAQAERVPAEPLERQLARELRGLLQKRLTPVERELRGLLLQKRLKVTPRRPRTFDKHVYSNPHPNPNPNPNQAEAEVKRLTAEVEHAISNGQAQFHTWRRRNMVALVGGGIVVGAAGFGGGGYIYVRR